MIQELPARNRSASSFRFKRYFESRNNRVRIFGQCEVTGKNVEINIAAAGFFIYVQGFQDIAQALPATSVEERDFILTGVSPEGRKGRVSGQLKESS